MENYKPNSHKSKESKPSSGQTPKKVEKVVSGATIVKKKSAVRKITDIFISEDADSVKDYIKDDVVIPTIKKLFCDIIKDSADIIFGGGFSRSGRRGDYGARYVSYDRFSDRRDDRRYTESRYSGFDYDNIILENKGDAEEVLLRLEELIDVYGQATVGDLFDLVGKSAPHTSNNYGWTALRNARSERVREGYLLKLPRALPIER